MKESHGSKCAGYSQSGLKKIHTVGVQKPGWDPADPVIGEVGGDHS